MGIANSVQKKHKKDGKDFYQTPCKATRALLSNITIAPTTTVLDPCEGAGAISRVLTENNVAYTGIDLFPILQTTIKHDFLTYTEKCPLIIGNPPYSKKNEFIEHALTIAKEVYFILPMQIVNYNHFHRTFLNREEYKGRILMTPKFFMSDTLSGNEQLVRGGVSSYAWFHWVVNDPNYITTSYEKYFDLDRMEK